MKTIQVMCHSALLLAATALLVASLPLSASDVDSRIESSAKQSYVFRTYLQQDDIKIESHHGAVVLTGSVASESHKSMAEDTVADLPGVRSVDNKLEVEGQSSTPYSDSWIGDKVKTSLLFHRSVSGLHTDVDVREGVVTLRGAASSNAEKELATEYARDVDGVKSVDNQMTVSSEPVKSNRTVGEKIDDSSITTQVKIALLFHKSTSAIHTKVKTRNGVVTVRGTAQNRAERRLVTKIVKDIHGVLGVNNKMTIESGK